MQARALSSQTGPASPWRKLSFKHWDLSFDTSWIYIDILVFHESGKRLQLFIKGFISLVAAVWATEPRWPHHPPLQLLPLSVRVNRKQGEALPRKQPALPPGSRCFPPPRSFLSPTPPPVHVPVELGWWLVPRCRGQGAHSCSVLSPELLGISWSIYKLAVTHSLWVSAFTGAICHFRGQNIIFRGKKNPSNFMHFLIIHILPSHPFIASHSSLFLMTQRVISCLHWISPDAIISLP